MRGVYIIPEDELAEGVEPLTSDERRWLGALQRVLARCPKRLELTTVGDRGIGVIDAHAARAEQPDGSCGLDDIHDGGASRLGLELAQLNGGPKVHGISG